MEKYFESNEQLEKVFFLWRAESLLLSASSKKSRLGHLKQMTLWPELGGIAEMYEQQELCHQMKYFFSR